MSRFDELEENIGELLGNWFEQAKEVSARQMERVNEAVNGMRAAGSDGEQEKTAEPEADKPKDDWDLKAEVQAMSGLLKEQEAYMTKLGQMLDSHQDKIDSLQQHFDLQTSLIETSVQQLKEDSSQRAIQLKDMLTNKQDEVPDMEEALAETVETLMKQQRSHTVEVDRLLTVMKTSLEKEIEGTGESINKKIDRTIGLSNSINRITMVMVILNILCLIGYIAFDLFVGM